MDNMREFDLGNKEKFWEIYDKEILPSLLLDEKKRQEELKKIVKQRILVLVKSIPIMFCAFVATAFFVRDFWASLIVTLFLWVPAIIHAQILFNKELILNTEQDYVKNLKKIYLDRYLSCFNGLIEKRNSGNMSSKLKKSHLYIKADTYIIDDVYQIKNEVNIVTLIESKLFSHDKHNSQEKKEFKGISFEFKLSMPISKTTIITEKKNCFRWKYINAFEILLLSNISLIYLGILFLFILNHLYIVAFLFLLLFIVAIWFTIKTIRNQSFYKKYTKLKKDFRVFYIEDVLLSTWLKNIFCHNRDNNIFLVQNSLNLWKFKHKFKIKNISASFYDDKLMIAIDTKKDLFEIGDLWHPLTDRKYAEDFYNEMSSILRMIEYFKLDEKTGL